MPLGRNTIKYNKLTTFTKHIFLLLAFCICSQYTSAIEVDHFKRLNARDGLSHNSVLCMLEDSKGFMWFGTWNGLNRYDGYRFKVFRSLPGQERMLSHNRITSLYEDPHGFIWIKSYDGFYHIFNPKTEEFITPIGGTKSTSNIIEHFLQVNNDEVWLGSGSNGLYRFIYDSAQQNYIVHNYTAANSGLSNNYITLLHKDEQHIWIGTSKGINQSDLNNLSQEKLELTSHYQNTLITSIASNDKNTWIGTKNGLIYFNHKQQKFSRAAIPLIRINALAIAPKGKILVATDRLLKYDYKYQTTEVIPHQGSYTTRIYPDKKGAYWVATATTGINRIDSTLRNSKYFELTPKSIINQIEEERPVFYEDSDSNLWIGVHGGGLSLYNEETESLQSFRNNPLNPNSISSNFIHCITEDKFGTIWVGSGQPFGSINKIITRHKGVRNIIPKHNSSNNSDNVVRALLEDSNGNIWVSTKKGIVYIYDKSLQLIHNFPFAPIEPNGSGFNVYTMFQDTKGYIWLGAKTRGIGVTQAPLSNDKNAYKNLKFDYYQRSDNEESLVDNDVYSITEDHLGRIWIATFSSGINIMEHPSGKANKPFIHINSSTSNLKSNNVRYLYRDSRNNMWIATANGLYEISAQNLEKNHFIFDAHFQTTEKESISYNDIVHICEDSKGRLWFATLGGGFNLLKKPQQKQRQFIYFTQQEGLSNDEVHSIAEDNHGLLWIATENGIHPFNPETQSFKQYEALNRLTNTSFSESTVIKLRNGSIVLGTSKGLEVIQPDLLKHAQPLSQTRFTTLLISNKEVAVKEENSPLVKAMPFTEHITLNHDQSSFSLNFSALNFQDKELIQYNYFLDGFDKQWTVTGNNNVATYTNIPPGEYTLKVQANSEYILPATLNITILAPWYQTTIAYIIYVLIVLTVIYLITQYSRRIRLYKSNLQVEKRVNELKLRFFTNISHEIRTPLTLIMGPLEDLKNSDDLSDETNRLLDTMMRNGKRMLHLINQLLDFRKVQNEKMKLQISKAYLTKIVHDNYANFELLAAKKQINFVLNTVEINEPLWIDIPKVDTVLFNLLSNAFKFTPAGKSITLTLKDLPEKVEVSVTDTGKGIETERLSQLFTRYETLSDETGQGGGTGIGLNLSYELIKLHDGDIKVTSAPNEGSSFVITLNKGNSHLQNKSNVHFISDTNTPEEHTPVSEQLTQLVENNETSVSTPANKEKTILIVEDNEDILDYITTLFDNDFNIIKATNGVEGLEKAKAENPDLLISDVMMPVMDGIAMTTKIKSDFEICHIPVVMLTAKTTTNDKIKGVGAGAEAYVTKPFSGTYLKTVVQNLLKQRQLILHRLQDKTEIGPQNLNISEKDETFLTDLVKHIEENYQNNKLSVEELSEVLCVSRTVFYNKVKSLTGLSPIEFIRQMKLKIAAQLLSKGYNVSEVALLIGYNDIKYFSRKFKEQFGYPPSKHIKMTAE